MLVCVLSVAPRHQQKGPQNPRKVCETEWSLQRSEEANSQAGVWPQPCCPPPNGTTSPLCIPVARLRVISLAWEWHQQWQTVRTSLIYHLRELPQVSFLSQQKFCRDKHVFVVTKYVFWCDKSMLVATKLLSQQTYFCCNKTFVVSNICRSKVNFVWY